VAIAAGTGRRKLFEIEVRVRNQIRAELACGREWVKQIPTLVRLCGEDDECSKSEMVVVA